MKAAKRYIIGGLAALAVAGLGMIVPMESDISAQGASYDNRSLRGDYKFNIVEVRSIARGGIDFCEETGTASFDGRGNASVASVRRCSNPPSTEKTTSALTYAVKTDGQVTFDDVGGPAGSTTHGWIVDGGNMILVDGTTRSGTSDTLVTHGVGAKQ